MSDEAPVILAPDGRSARSPVDGRCPRCGAGSDKRVNTAGFGPAVICCSDCGHHYEGATE